MLLFVSPQDVSRLMRHVSRSGHIRQKHKTPRLLRLTGQHLSPLVQGGLQTIAERFDHAGRLLAWPTRAILGALLDQHLHAVIGALQCPQLGGGGFGIRVTEILLVRRLTPSRLQRRV